MLKIDYSNIIAINNSTELSDLFPFIQKAIELEHSTIPPYLTALFSIKSGSNRDISRLIYSVVIEEMLHFTIACNILNAFGGKPQIYFPAFIPNYPTSLPLNINNSLIVGLERFSKRQLTNVFMEIEEPEIPLVFPKNISFLKEDNPQFGTIGLFYAAIKEKIKTFEIETLPGNKAYQVISDRFSNRELFPILSKQDALNAIDIIVEQGEGTTIKPIDQFNHLAHYYRFKEINIGRKLIENNSIPQGYSYTGDDIELEEDKVYPIFPDTKLNQLLSNSIERNKAELFATTYTKLLKELDDTFNGSPQKLDDTFNTMANLRTIAEELVVMPFPTKPAFNVGPTFEFLEEA